MNIKKILFVFFVVFFCGIINSQNFTRPNDWKKYRKELVVQGGASGFLGDLGGTDNIGKDYSPADLEYALARPALSIGYRYKLNKTYNIFTSFNYMLVTGDDKLTSEPFRNNRNLNFKSNIFEFSTRFEYSFFASRPGHRYSIKKTLLRRKRGKAKEFIAFIGVGCFYFNPKGKHPFTGEYMNLYDLHTEGQGLKNGPEQYSRIQLSIPVGFSIKTRFKKYWSLGLEFNYRKTFTDYIDDVSGTYYNKSELAEAYGSNSVIFSDPSLGLIPSATIPNADGTGAQRGDKQKDVFMSLQVTVGKFFPPKRRKTRLRSKF